MRSPCAAAALLALASGALALPPAEAAGRRPYGGSVTVPVRDFAGLDDPHRAATPSQRLAASLGHCGLFRVDGAGAPVAELARDGGRIEDGWLHLQLVDGATFHDGAVVTAGDVRASLERLAEVAPAPALPSAWRALRVRTDGAFGLRVRGPRGVDADALRRLLGRVEAAVLREGRPGARRGCGPYRVLRGGGAAQELVAHPGHPRGRPWLDNVVLRRAAGAEAEIRALVFGDVDLATEASPRYRDVVAVDAGGAATVMAVPGPGRRGARGSGFRRALAAEIRTLSLARHVDWPARPAVTPWPPGLAIVARPPPAPGPAAAEEEIVVAYPEGDAMLGEVARVVRDRIATRLARRARAVGVVGLDLAGAARATVSPWDLALVVHVWGARTPGQAALELAEVLGLPGLDAGAALAGDVRRWAEGVIDDAVVVPILHLARPIWVRRPDLRLVPGGAGRPEVAESWIGAAAGGR